MVYAARIKIRWKAVSLFLHASVERRRRSHKTRKTRAAEARGHLRASRVWLDGLRVDFHCRVILRAYVVKFTFENKIEAMHGDA